MVDTPFRQDQNLASREGVIAGVLCAVIPLTITGILLFRYLTQRGSFGDFLMTTMVFVFAITQLMAEDFTPPSNKFKLLYGIAYGMMVSLIGIILALAATFFVI